MMKYFVVLLLQLFHYSIAIDYDGWLNIKIEHSINCNTERFCSRGSISLKSIRSGASIIDQITFNKQHIQELKPNTQTNLKVKATLNLKKLSDLTETLKLRASLKLRRPTLDTGKIYKELADVGGFYSIRALCTSPDIMETEYLSSMKAQTFLDSGLSDIINVWILPNGAVMAVNFQVTENSNHTLSQKSNSYKLNSKLYLRYVEQAPVPDTTSYIQKLEREREAREKGEVKDNRSFLAKYWMYIVPVAIFVMISGATNPEPAAQATR